MVFRVRVMVALGALLPVASLVGCSPAPPNAEPPPPAPAQTKVDLSPLGEDLRRAVLDGEEPFKRGGWMGRLEERVPGFSVSSPDTATMNGTVNGHPQNSFTLEWETNDRALTRVAFEAMLPKLFDEVELIVAEVVRKRGVPELRPGNREPSADGLPQLSIQYQSAGNVGWVQVRQKKSAELVIIIDLIEEPK